MNDSEFNTLFLMESEIYANRLTEFVHEEGLYTRRVNDLQVLVYTDDNDTVNYIKENCEGICFSKLMWMD